jgi:hypothetical protein
MTRKRQAKRRRIETPDAAKPGVDEAAMETSKLRFPSPTRIHNNAKPQMQPSAGYAAMNSCHGIEFHKYQRQMIGDITYVGRGSWWLISDVFTANRGTIYLWMFLKIGRGATLTITIMFVESLPILMVLL